MKHIFYACLLMVGFSSCTKNFESINQNPNQISDEMLKQDFNLVGSPFSGMLYELHGNQGSQTQEDLCYDSWMGYMNTPTGFVSNRNNTTYYITWNSYWGRQYNNVMSPARQVIKLAQVANKGKLFDFANLIT